MFPAVSIGTSAKGLNKVILDEKTVKGDRGNVSVPLVRASRESRAFAFLSPKEPFAAVSIVTCINDFPIITKWKYFH
tara:strand:+ start:4131 stop:4361 length:231 start_codon:yes stop_codon:yes gene_type:complete